MSYTSDYYDALEKLKKRKNADTDDLTGLDDYSAEYYRALNQAQSRQSSSSDTSFVDDIAPTRGGNKESIFKAGSFDDGYQFGDITSAILGTTADAGIGLVKGVGRLVEGVVDLGTYGVAYAGDALGFDKFAEDTKKVAQYSATDEWTKGMTDYVDQYSVLGNKADMVSEGLGQVAAIVLTGGALGAAGVGTAGVTAVTTGLTGLSGMGSGMSEAYNSGATDEEAFTYGFISGTAEAATELLFGGLGKASKAIGIGKSAVPLDDMLAKKVSSKFTSQIAKNFAEYGIKAGAEGTEEVLSGIIQAVGKKATYMSEEELGNILADENLLEQFIVGTVTSGIAQSGYVPGMKSGSLREANKTGRDFITGYTANEQAVIDKVVESRVAEQEKNGKTLSKKEIVAIEEQVQEALEKGQLDIDTIEEVLGGDTYTAYKDHLTETEKLKKELDELSNIEEMRLTRNQKKRLAELEAMNLDDTTKSTELRKQLTDKIKPLLKGSKLTETFREVARKEEAFTVDTTKYKGKQKEAVERAIKSGVLNNTYRAHELVDVLSKIEAEKGIVFDYTNNEKLKQSGFAIKGKTVNGFEKDGTVTLNVQSSKAWQSTVGHEITHVLEGTESYGALQSALFEYAESKKEYQSRYDTLAELYKGVKGYEKDFDTKIKKELTADLVGDYLFTDKAFINHLTGNRNLFQKIYDEIKYLCKVATGKEKAEIEKVKRAFDEAWKQMSVKTNATNEATNEATKADDVKYSVSAETDTEYMSAVERGDTETAQKIVDEAAKNAGYGIKAYHGTGYDFTVFDKSKQGDNYQDWGRLGKGFYFAPTSREAETWAELSKGGKNKVMPVYLRSENMLDSFEALPDNLKDTIPENWDSLTRRLAEKYAYNYIEYMQEFGYNVQQILTEKGYDGINGHTEFVVFDPEQVKSADAVTYDDKGNIIPLSERFNTANEDIRYSIAGKNSETADNSLLARANDMLYKGIDSETVRQETGWYKGYDGKWRYEIDDSRFEFHPDGQFTNPDVLRYRELQKKFINGDITENEFKEMQSLTKALKGVKITPDTLGDVVSHKELFEAYPQLKNVKFTYNTLDKGTHGSYSPNNKAITLNNSLIGDNEAIKNTLIHEIQHAIQDIEGFAQGASTEYWKAQRQDIVNTLGGARANLDLWLDDIGYHEFAKSSMQEVANREKTLEQHWEDCKAFKENSKYAEQIANCEAEITEFQKQYDEITKGMTAYEQYRNTAGEIEAWDTGNRLNLTAEERKNKRPDIDNPDAIVLGAAENGTFDPDIRFSLSQSVEETKDLMALHNLHSDEMLKQLEMGGLPYPSIAITKPDAISHDDFGEITLVLNKDAIDPKKSKHNKVYSADGYTPTFPSVAYEASRQVAESISDKVKSLIDKVPERYQESLRYFRDPTNVDERLNNAGGEQKIIKRYTGDYGFKQLYLAEKGKAVPVQTKRTEAQMTDYQKELYQSVADKLGADVVKSFNEKGNFDKVGLARIAWFEQYGETLKEVYADSWSAGGTMTKAEALEIAAEQPKLYWVGEVRKAVEYLETGGMTINEENDYRATEAKIDEQINESDYKQWLNNLFKGIEGRSGIRNNKDRFTPSGKRRSFEQLHDPVTLDAVIKVMRGKEQTGQGAFGIGNIQGASVKEYSSIGEIKANADRLGTMEQAKHDEAVQYINDTFYDIVSRYSNGKDILDARATVCEAVSRNESKEGIARYLKQYDYVYKYTDDIGNDIIALRDYIRGLTTPYFEAKPRRAVGFDEVAAFVIPNNADAKLKQELLNRGYNIAEYDPNIEGDRQRVVNRFEDYKFSLSNVGDEYTPTGNYSTPLNETYLAPTKEDVPAFKVEAETSNLPIWAENQIANYKQSIAEEKVNRKSNRKPTNSAIKRYATKKSNRPKFQGAKVVDGKQYITHEGTFIVELNTPDGSIPNNNNLPTDQIKNFFTNADKNAIDGTFEIDGQDISAIYKQVPKGKENANVVVVGNDYYDIGYVDAVLKAIENPTISQSGLTKDHRLLVVKGDNGQAIICPLNIPNLNRANFVYKAVKVGESFDAPIVETAVETPTYTQTENVDAPNLENIAPLPDEQLEQGTHTAIKPKREKQPSLKKIDNADGEAHVAKVLTEEPKVEKKRQGILSRAISNFVDKGAAVENLYLKTKNRALQDTYKAIGRSETKAQYFMEHGKGNVKSLDAIRTEIEATGQTKDFYNYVYHKHNIGRMSLESKEQPNLKRLEGKMSSLKLLNLQENQLRAIASEKITKDTPQKRTDLVKTVREYLASKDVKNKPVFDYSVTAEMSQDIVNEYEAQHPQFKEIAQDVYDYMNYLRDMMVSNGIISQETADLWAEMYPYFVPIRRAGHEGASVDVPLDTNKTGINAPIKRATGGNSDILPLLDTMALRTLQTFKAIDKNRFGVELKNTLGGVTESTKVNLDEAIDSIDTQEDLLQEGKNGKNPTFTVFEGGERVTFEITDELFDAMKPTSEGLSYTNKVLNKASNLHRGVLTEYSVPFMVTNAIKDAQDVLINSQHPAKTYANFPTAINELRKKGKWYTEYMENGGGDNTYFDKQTKTFTEEKSKLRKIVGFPLDKISEANNFIERIPRLAEYIASRQNGASVEAAMLDAARVTTDFSAGGDVTKFLNRNGATFLNASVQGFAQTVRNVREAKMNGLKGWLGLASKVALAGLPALLVNKLFWDDDDEYEELSDYVKENYYIVGKYGDGKFVRIPKGRALAVIQNGFEQIGNTLTGDDEADFGRFFELFMSNLAPNNPLDNNIIAPIKQVIENKTWYGEDLVPTRLQDLPAAEQYDESTDAISKWLGENLDISPYKINYLLNQYSGGVGDIFLPMLTPEAESGDNSLLGNMIAPLKDKFTTDSVMNNQNVSDFYDTVDVLTTNAKSSYATDEDILKSKYINSANTEMGELYKAKREIQNSNLSDSVKYEQVRNIQKQINALAENALNSYESVNVQGGYATVGDKHYRLDNGTWTKISDKQLERQREVTNELGISPSEYWSETEISFFPNSDGEYEFAYDNPGRYAVSKVVGGYDAYKTYATALYDIKADKDSTGKSITGSRKEKVLQYINNLDADYATKIILFKAEYPSDDTYNAEIINYLNNRGDLTYDDRVAILTELGFRVVNGQIYAD